MGSVTSYCCPNSIPVLATVDISNQETKETEMKNSKYQASHCPSLCKFE